MPKQTAKQKPKPEPETTLVRVGIRMSREMYMAAIERVAAIKTRFAEYTFADYVRDLLRRDQGQQTTLDL